ncbi:MAG: bifunctional folylpolyglutamate synthase/dihydrofolate synthase [Bacteroidales bacterium]|nr:bifunctional folylpolyglutamate synthase/dihydrofolate synthase [Bacteroidales bacterium]
MVERVKYEEKLSAIFSRFPSVQTSRFADAYKPGLDHMRQFAAILGNPQEQYRTIHVAGTNGKGSVSSMLSSVLMAKGCRTGLYTSPHLVDFRERMKVDGKMPPEEWVYDFLVEYGSVFESLDLSFFEITTGMALKWFAQMQCDWAVIEVGLGGRLDSTNIITPELCVITSIGLDHCALLGNTLAEIAAEKAGIFKEDVPAVIGEVLPETLPVFLDKALGPLYFADPRGADLPEGMDLRGDCQRKNLATVLKALEVLGIEPDMEAIKHTAERTGLRGRWEKLRDNPLVICDIGHNAAALGPNFRQLESLGRPMTIIYAVMADKDLDAIIPLLPTDAKYIFVTPPTPRALPAEQILERVVGVMDGCPRLRAIPDVARAIAVALEESAPGDVIYIGGSTFAVTEAVKYFQI